MPKATKKEGNVFYHVYKRFSQWLRLRLGVAISRALDLHAARYWPAGCLQAAAVHYGTRTAAILAVHRFVIKSLLFTCKWIG